MNSKFIEEAKLFEAVMKKHKLYHELIAVMLEGERLWNERKRKGIQSLTIKLIKEQARIICS